MPADVTMPRMGQSMETGVILKWLKQPGDTVKHGDPLVEIETDKATVDIQSFHSGTVTELVAQEGDTVEVGAVIARIEEQHPERVGQAATPALEAVALPAELIRQMEIALPANGTERVGQAATPTPEAVSFNGATRKGQRPNASPLAKRLASAHGIDLLALTGSGPGGRIGKADIDSWIAQPRAASVPQAIAPTAPITPPAPIPAQTQTSGKRVPLNKMRQTAARRMLQSKQQAPHFYVAMDVEMTRALQLRESLKARGIAVSVNDLILKAAALALVQFPNLNATFDGDAIIQHADVNLAVAVAVDEGLLTPVVSRCQTLALPDLAAQSRQAAERARAGRLNATDLDGGTFTVSNLGMFGVKHFEAIVNPPHAAILAVGAVQRVPVFDAQDRVVAAQLMTATVSADHRVTDGAEVARFLTAFKGALEDGFALVSSF